MLQNFVNQSAMHFALRQMQQTATSPRFWLAISAVVIILAISGPFNTLAEFSFPKRLAYWGAIAVSTYFGSIFVSNGVYQALRSTLHNRGLRIALAGFAGGILVTLIVWFISAFIAGNAAPNHHALIKLAAQCIPIAMVITAGVFLLADPPHNDQGTELENLFFARLPVALGRDIISVQSQDHYLRVVTTKGSNMILMRLSDAIIELEGTKGIQTHRSWWVATKHITKKRKEGGKVTLVLSDGQIVPVSRNRVGGLSCF